MECPNTCACVSQRTFFAVDPRLFCWLPDAHPFPRPRQCIGPPIPGPFGITRAGAAPRYDMFPTGGPLCGPPGVGTGVLGFRGRPPCRGWPHSATGLLRGRGRVERVGKEGEGAAPGTWCRRTSSARRAPTTNTSSTTCPGASSWTVSSTPPSSIPTPSPPAPRPPPLGGPPHGAPRDPRLSPPLFPCLGPDGRLVEPQV